MQLTQHVYSDKPTRCYIDGKRVSRDTYWSTIGRLERQGRTLNSFATKAKVLPDGSIHRVNYSSI